MISNLRNFAKTGIAKVLMVIIIIPFVFWGMGGVFSGGSTNSIAKINNYNIWKLLNRTLITMYWKNC